MKLEQLVEDFFASGKQAAVSTQGDQLHAFRIAAKRLRYSLEILDPQGAKEWLERLRTVQKELGDMNDALVAERYLRRLPSLSKQARPLLGALHREAESHIAKFHRTWRRSFGPRAEQAWLAWARSIDSQ
jgi:CHAD domain-containing protein